LLFAAVCVLLLAPTVLPIAAWAAARRWRRRCWHVLLVPLTIYGAALAFQAFSYATGSTFPFLRFYIIAIPLSSYLTMLAVPDGQLVTAKRRGKYAPEMPPPTRRRQSWAVYLPVAAAAALAVPVTAWGMGQPKYAPQEYALGAVLAPDPSSISDRKTVEHRTAASFSTERHIARYLGTLNLPESSVITDTVYGFAIIAASRNPKTFVVPSDPDFTTVLNAPAENGVRYLLAVPPVGRGLSDSLNLRYPTLYETGADIATLQVEIPNDGDSQPNWRLYRVNEPVA